MSRANDPLACLLYLLARNSVPWGMMEAIVEKATSDVTPAMPAEDPIVQWANATAEQLRSH